MKSEQEIKKVIRKLKGQIDEKYPGDFGNAIYGTYISVLEWVIGKKDTVISRLLENKGKDNDKRRKKNLQNKK